MVHVAAAVAGRRYTPRADAGRIILETRQLVRFALAIASTSLLASSFTACATGPLPQTRSPLLPVRTTVFDELHRLPAADLGSYSALWVDAVEIAPDLDTADHRYRRSYLENVERLALAAFTREFERYGVVDTPQPGVLGLRIVLTALRANRAYFDSTAERRLERSFAVGGAAARIELRDAVSGELLLLVVDGHYGDEFSRNDNLASRWGDAEDAFRYWARHLRARLDRARARPLAQLR
jgi:hypothetical protein